MFIKDVKSNLDLSVNPILLRSETYYDEDITTLKVDVAAIVDKNNAIQDFYISFGLFSICNGSGECPLCLNETLTVGAFSLNAQSIKKHVISFQSLIIHRIADEDFIYSSHLQPIESDLMDFWDRSELLNVPESLEDKMSYIGISLWAANAYERVLLNLIKE